MEDPAATSSWRVTYLRLHARTLPARDAKSLSRCVYMWLRVY